MTPERFAKLQRALDRRQPDLTVFLDSVNKAQNLTSIVRTADAVGIQRLHATDAGDAMRLHHMIAGSAKHWVAVTLHRSTRVGLAELRKEQFNLRMASASGQPARPDQHAKAMGKIARVKTILNEMDRAQAGSKA